MTEADLEKQSAVTVNSPPPTSSQPQRHPHPTSRLGSKTRQRLTHFLHPSGKRIHVATSPSHAESLRRHLSQVHSNDPDAFDIHISGTPEHLEALRATQDHHEERRDALARQHQDVYDQFSNVHAELDALANELDRVTTHGVALSAHFSRFGYDAHVRSYDDNDENSENSGTTTPRSGTSSEKKESAAERGFAEPLKLFVTPTVRQYFHKGILWRASDSEEVQCFELFVDLLYVGIIAVNADLTAERPTGESLLHFVITFTLSYKIWNDMSLFISWFKTDDVFTRVCILFLLAILFGYTTNITEAFDNTYPTLIGFYLAARLFMAAYLALILIWIPMIRGVVGYYLIVILLSTAIWIITIHVPLNSGVQIGLIFLAMWADVFLQISYIFLMRAGSTRTLRCLLGSRICTALEQAFEYVPAINIEHRVERMSAFVTLVFGYTVVAILYQSTRNGVSTFYAKAVLGLIQSFVFNWLYFEVDAAHLRTHAIRRHKLSALAWASAHLPFISAFVLAGGALARLVVAADSPDADIAALAPVDAARSAAYVPPGIRWFYCAGTALALAMMGLIAACHVHREYEGHLRLAKRWRMAWRGAVAVTILCLPLAGDRLDSLALVAIVAGCLVACLALELWACSRCTEAVFGREGNVTYFGRCGKGKVEAMVKGGMDVDVDALVDDKDKHSGVAAAGH